MEEKIFETLYFPKLNFGVELNPVAFSIGNIHVYWYGMLIAVGFVLALVYAFLRFKEFGLNADRMIDVIIGGVIGGVVGGRLYYVIFKWSYYKDHLSEVYRTWEGGMAIYGSVIGAMLMILVMCKWRKMPVLTVMDLVGNGFLIGQAVGRWGNFINLEAFGSNTTLPWGMTSTSIAKYLSRNSDALEAMGVKVVSTDPVHPCFLYESIWCLIGFILLALYVKNRKFDGEVFLMYVAWYGIGRSFIEGLRTDSLLIGTIRVSQLLAIVSAIASVVLILVIRRKIAMSGDPDYLPLYVDTDASKNFEADRVAEEELNKKRKASKKEDLARAEELYAQKQAEKKQAKEAAKEARRLAREADYEDDEETVEEDEEASEESDEVAEEVLSSEETLEEEESTEQSSEMKEDTEE